MKLVIQEKDNRKVPDAHASGTEITGSKNSEGLMSPVTVWLVAGMLATAPGDPLVFGQLDDDWPEFRGLVGAVAVRLIRRQTALAPSDTPGLLFDDVRTLLGDMGFAHEFLLAWFGAGC
jgi:hypothetical protein